MRPQRAALCCRLLGLMGACCHRCRHRAAQGTPSDDEPEERLPFHGMDFEVFYAAEREAQTPALAGAAPLWAVLAQEEWGIVPRTQAQVWRRRRLEEEMARDREAELEERRRREARWLEQMQALQAAPSLPRGGRSRTPRAPPAASSS